LIAQQQPLQYSRLTAENGLSNNSVQCILQDNTGIVCATGEDGGDEKKKQKNNQKATAPKEKQLQQMHATYNKRAFRQPRNALQNNAMFFSHASPVTRPRI